jgi:phenylalanyl-tRNA synthetase beta chain
MKISLNWLNQYFSHEIDPKILVKKFNLMSQEVAGLKKLVDIDGLVIGHVKSLKKHEDADKLSVCIVDVGDEDLQIICGAPNVAENQKVIVAKSGVVLPGNFKIKKAKIRGVESNGMICSLAELGIQEFDSSEKGIYVLGDDALVGNDPLDYLHLKDFVLELDLTANRSDLLSMRGVAYDTATMLDLDLQFKVPNVIREASENPISIYTQTKNSSAYYGQVLENINIKESPYWLKSRLIASGIRPINNVVDITNYVMLEYGQPLHAFDFDLVKSDKIIVREALKDEVIITLDGENRKLIADDIVITDGKKPIALAGVMGGLETEINNDSKRVLLESAIFNPVKVRRTASRLNLKSESSSRFEKGVDPESTLPALNYACELLVKYADAVVVGEPSFYNIHAKKKNIISLSMDKLNSVTGVNFDSETVENILDKLRFKYKLRNDEFKVTVPSRRPMDSYQDLIEEIVRINGYDKIPTTIPLTPTQGGLNKKQRIRRTVRDYFVNRGFYETRTYSLVSKEMAVAFDQEVSKTIKILNPLTKEREHLRHSILPSLQNVLAYNKARKIDDVFIFEITNTYFDDNEKTKLAILMHGKLDCSSWQKPSTPIDFYHLKGLIETLFKTLKITDYEFAVSEVPLVKLHPGISATIKINHELVGFLGRLHPEEEHKLGIDNIYVSEIDLMKVINNSVNANLTYQEISKYPSIERDVAFFIDKEVKANEIIECINSASKKILSSIEIFDVYYDKNLENQKSIALRLKFSSNSRTLETTEVDEQIQRIVSALNKDLSATLRS